MAASEILGLTPKGAPPSPLAQLKASQKRGASQNTFSANRTSSGKLTTLAPTVPLAKRRKLKRRSVPWVWRYFHSSARSDHIRLCHWVKGSDDPARDYPFAKFNKEVNMVKYTDEEYEKHFKDSRWTKEETDHLFDLCHRFGLRFVVIADRFEGNKTLEDLKERFYSVSRTLLTVREEKGSFVSREISTAPVVKVAGITGAAEPDLDWKQHLEMFVYDKDRDIKRKKQLEGTISRNYQQVREEEHLMQEFKRIESRHKASSVQRKRALKMAQDVLSSRPLVVAKPKTATPKPSKKRKREEKDPRQNKGGNYLRSTRSFASGGAKMTARVNAAFEELQIPDTTMTTARVSKVLGELRSEVSVLLELHEQLMSAEHEASLLRTLARKSPPLEASCGEEPPSFTMG